MQRRNLAFSLKLHVIIKLHDNERVFWIALNVRLRLKQFDKRKKLEDEGVIWDHKQTNMTFFVDVLRHVLNPLVVYDVCAYPIHWVAQPVQLHEKMDELPKFLTSKAIHEQQQ